MRERLYPETLPALASYWLKTICEGRHNRAWWEQLEKSLARAARKAPLEAFAHDVLLSTREWVKHALRGGEPPSARRSLEPPFRSLPVERSAAYIARLLNEWLPTEVARVLTDEDERGAAPEAGIPALAVAKALDRLLARERLAPETLETFLAPALLTPKMVYPADTEILRDVVLAMLGRVSAPRLPMFPAVSLGVMDDDALNSASWEQTESGEELRVPVTEEAAARILGHDLVRIGPLIVTLDGRAWQPWTLHRGARNFIVYRPGPPLRIDSTADHAKLTVPWSDRPSGWTGEIPMPGPFELFGREWRASSWELDGDSTALHLTFSRVLTIAEPALRTDAEGRLHPAYVDMAWSELEHALADAVAGNSVKPIEQMRRNELIPLGRALSAFAESVASNWRWNSKQVETRLRAVRYHQTSLLPVYGRAPWRVLPPTVQANLAKRALTAGTAELVGEIFSEVPEGVARNGAAPHQAA
jgi:hypothetical protein